MNKHTWLSLAVIVFALLVLASLSGKARAAFPVSATDGLPSKDGPSTGGQPSDQPPKGGSQPPAASQGIVKSGGCGVYDITTSTATLVPGTVDIGNHCDDCTTTIALPFPVQIYDQTYSSVRLSSNGVAEFLSQNPAYFQNACLPASNYTYTVFAFWDDLRTDSTVWRPCLDCGIYTSVSGNIPQRIFNIEWRAYALIGTGPYVNFELRLYEDPAPHESRFDLVYGQVDPNGQSLLTPSLGVQRDGTNYTQYVCNDATGLTPGLVASYTLPVCGTPRPTNTPFQPSPTPMPTSTPCPPGPPQVITGAITSTDPTQTGRLFRDAVADTCAVPGACGQPYSGTYHYDLYSYTNTSGSTQCIQVRLTTTCQNPYIYSGAYLGSFDPANICANFVASIGMSPNPTGEYSFLVPAGDTFLVNVHEVTANAGCPSYTLTITGLPVCVGPSDPPRPWDTRPQP